jgi:hypothetical protein
LIYRNLLDLEPIANAKLKLMLLAYGEIKTHLECFGKLSLSFSARMRLKWAPLPALYLLSSCRSIKVNI